MLDLDLENRIVAALRQIMRAVDLHSRQLVGVCGLTGPQLAVLQAVARLSTGSATEIAREVHLSLPTVTGILRRLESRQMISRRPADIDRRKTVITLTDQGSTTLAEAPSLLQDQFRRRLGELEEWERHQMLASLYRIASLMGAEKLDTSPHLVADGPEVDPAATPDAVSQTSPPEEG